MKKKLGAVLLVVALVLSFGLVPAASAAVTSISGGNSVIQRTLPDNARGTNMIDMNNAIDADGVITSWSIWADRTTEPVKLKIYRATANPNVFTVVGQSSLVTPASLGLNTFTLSTPILVEAGDYVGWRYPSTNTNGAGGCISFDYTSSGSVRWSNYPTTQDGAKAETDSLPNTGGRVYSIAVSGTRIELTATPEIDFNPVDTDHTITADIGTDVAGVTVNFEVISGPNSTDGVSGSNDTDSSGEAEFTYSSSDDGKDTIRVWIDQNCSGVFDAGDVSVEVEKYWLENFVTGGGKININTLDLSGKKAAFTFGGTVGVVEGDSIVGQFQIVNHVEKEAWHCNNNFTALSFSGPSTTSPPASHNTATFTGTFTSNRGSLPETVTITIEDLGEPGAGVDTIEFDSFGPIYIDGGNFQVHDIEPPTP